LTAEREDAMQAVAWVLGLTMAVIVVSRMPPGAHGHDGQGNPGKGRQLYATHCATCHGVAGHGDGPTAQYLNVPPADLTGIAGRNRGVFPTEVIHRIVDGRRALRTHGDSAMPIWGDVFSLSGTPETDKAIGEKIRALVAYVETLQQRPGD
jgi:mono/diheme cytochrome c family protein